MGLNEAIQVKGYTPLRIDRIERKCQVDDLTLHQVQSIIKSHPKLFYAPYPPRYVNNLYLDTVDLENYFANINGFMDRRKVRIRWYGDIFGEIVNPVLEIKLKRGLIGNKQAYQMACITLDKSLCNEKIHQCLRNSDLPQLVRLDLNHQRLVLFNRYYRYYYASRDGNFRVTVDTDLSFYKVNNAFSNIFLHHQKSIQIIVEIKYFKDYDVSAHRVISFFPFRVTRSSKYVQGIERVYF